MMQIGHLELFVDDPLASLSFYRDVLGFELVAVQEESFVWLRLGLQEILLRPGRPLSDVANYEDSRLAIVFYTTDLPGTVAALRQRGLVVEWMPNEESCYTFTDPDGNWFQLVDPTEH
ncbi:MAG: VOC family protein [Ardenticatenaceae bacterium]|nr:VOC family protein [Ardenticatenaceae bacterium]